MNSDTEVLGALLRLARRRIDANEAEVALRVRAQPREVRASLRRLSASGLVDLQSRRGGARLTLEGLALAVAILPRAAVRGASVAIRASRAA